MAPTRDRLGRWIAIAGLVAAVGATPSVATGAAEGQPVTGSPQVVVHDAPPVATELVAWAAGRFREAGLTLPPVQVSFHTDAAGCEGHLGFTRPGSVDLCIRLAMEAGPQRLVLHELAHAWDMATLTDACRERFLELRGLDRWSGDDLDWKRRGVEQSAEIVAWALGDGVMGPMIDGDRDDRALGEAFALLRTGCSAR